MPTCCRGSGPGCTVPTRPPSSARPPPGRRLPGSPRNWPSTGIWPAEPGEALVWSVRAADSAERVYAHAEAARHCERAVELWDQASGAADLAGTDRVSLHMRAARAWECAGDEIRALAHVGEALRQVDPVADPARTGLLHHLRGWYGAGKADLDAVLAANREAVRLVPAEPPSTARARVLMGYGRALHIQAGRYEEAAAVHEQTLTAARRAGSHPQAVQAMAALGHARAVTGEVAAGIALLREACASADADLADSGEFPGDHEWRVARVAHVLLSDALLKTGRARRPPRWPCVAGSRCDVWASPITASPASCSGTR